MQTCTIKFAGEQFRGFVLSDNGSTVTVFAKLLNWPKRQLPRVTTEHAFAVAERACVLTDADRDADRAERAAELREQQHQDFLEDVLADERAEADEERFAAWRHEDALDDLRYEGSR